MSGHLCAEYVSPVLGGERFVRQTVGRTLMWLKVCVWSHTVQGVERCVCGHLWAGHFLHWVVRGVFLVTCGQNTTIQYRVVRGVFLVTCGQNTTVQYRVVRGGVWSLSLLAGPKGHVAVQPNTIQLLQACTVHQTSTGFSSLKICCKICAECTVGTAWTQDRV